MQMHIFEVTIFAFIAASWNSVLSYAVKVFQIFALQ